MNTAHAKLIVQNYSESSRCISQLSYYEILGAIVASLCHSEKDFDIQILPYLTGYPDAYLAQYGGISEVPPHVSLAVSHLRGHYCELLNSETFSLFDECNQAKDKVQPNSELVLWCEGFLQFYDEIEDYWQDDFELLAEVDESDEFYNIVAEHEATLDLLTTLIQWQQTLQENPDKTELLENSLVELIKAGSASVCHMYQLSELFYKMKLDTLVEEFEMEVAEREALEQLLKQNGDIPETNVIQADFRNRTVIEAVVAKIDPNDPCPCGSGKKYKSCCMKSD